MKNLTNILLLLPLSSFAKSNDMIDSVNHYFSIILNNERDSINQYNVNDKSFKKLNSLKVETDSSKFVNPIKHIDNVITKIKLEENFQPHSTTNYENFHFELKAYDFGDNYGSVALIIFRPFFIKFFECLKSYRTLVQRFMIFCFV